MNLVLKKTGHVEYTLFSEKGVVLYVFSQCHSKEDAENKARAWASSWNAVIIRTEDGQSK